MPLHLEIVTPDRLLVSDQADEVNIPGRTGYIGVLPGHAPLITELGVGQISYRKGPETHKLAVMWGFVEVLPDKVTILAETAERAQDIDLQRAQQDRERAMASMERFETPEQYRTAMADLAWAEERLRAGNGASRSDMANIVP